MKISKTLGCVLGLHVILAVLLIQPGCQTGQPPTQTSSKGYTQDRTMKTSVQGASRNPGDLIPATRTGAEGLDSAFNAGLESESVGFEPYESSVTPTLEPISNQQTVDIAGPSFQSYTIKKGDNLWSLSKRFGVSLNELYAANGLNKNSVLRVGQQIQIPSEGSTAAVNLVTPEVYQPSGYNQDTITYKVQRGDTLSKIAQRYDTSVGAIKAANGKSSDIIRVGETLTVPVGASATTAPVTTTPTLTTTIASSRSGATQTHTVKSGEYPAKIAKQYGMTTSELLAMNSISDPRKLRVGQELVVSGSGSASNLDSRIETVVAPAPAPATIQPAPSTSLQPAPVRTETITIIEADPLVEGEFNGVEVEVQDDSAFDNAVEIPVIRLQE